MRSCEINSKIVLCSVCNYASDANPCLFCSSPSRDRSRICVVEESSNVFAVEKMSSFGGLYHVLHGSLSPTRGISPDKLMLKNLFPRLSPENNQGANVEEIILATNPTIEGERTANYIERLLKLFGLKITRITAEAPNDSDSEFIN